MTNKTNEKHTLFRQQNYFALVSIHANWCVGGTVLWVNKNTTELQTLRCVMSFSVQFCPYL